MKKIGIVVGIGLIGILSAVALFGPGGFPADADGSRREPSLIAHLACGQGDFLALIAREPVHGNAVARFLAVASQVPFREVPGPPARSDRVMIENEQQGFIHALRMGGGRRLGPQGRGLLLRSARILIEASGREKAGKGRKGG